MLIIQKRRFVSCVILLIFSFSIIIILPTSYADSTISLDYFKKYQQWAKDVIEIYKNWGIELQEKNLKLNHDVTELTNKNKKLQSEIKNQQAKYVNEYKHSTSLERDYDKLVDDYNFLVNNHNSLIDNTKELDEWVKSEEKKPKTTIYNGTVNFEFYDSKENYYNWAVPIETYENYVTLERDLQYFDLRYPSGKIETHEDFTIFVEGDMFKDVIDVLYENSKDDYDFLKEVWYVTSNFSTYGYDIGEYPRYAIETFVRGQGDCEDTSILLSEMLRSSKYTKNWTIQLVYMDADNESNPKNINHIAVYVSNGDWGQVIETTSGSKEYGLEAYDNTDLQSWGFDV